MEGTCLNMERNRHIDCIAILKSVIESGRSETDWGALLNHGLKLLDATSPPTHGGGSFPVAGGGSAPAASTPAVEPSQTISGLLANLQMMPSKSGGTFTKFTVGGTHIACFDDSVNQVIPMMLGQMVMVACAAKRSACGKFINRSAKSIQASTATPPQVFDQDIPF
jgi:hypothetical protein